MKKFITGFIVCLLIFAAVSAIIRADLYTRSITGDMDRSAFSYEQVNATQGKLNILGNVFFVDLSLIDTLKDKFDKVNEFNLNFFPDFLINAGKIVKNTCSDVYKYLQTAQLVL